MLPWFVSTLLILSYSFTIDNPSDVEIDSRGVIWMLSSYRPVVTRFSPDGDVDSFEMDLAGLPVGLSLSPSGNWAVSCSWVDEIAVFSKDDILMDRLPADSPGDMIWKGLEIWYTDTFNGSVRTSSGTIVARDCSGSDSRLMTGSAGRVLLTGERGSYLISEGAVPELLPYQGSLCFTQGSLMILNEGVVYSSSGDTLATGLESTRLATSPSGDIVVAWGNGPPVLLE